MKIAIISAICIIIFSSLTYGRRIFTFSTDEPGSNTTITGTQLLEIHFIKVGQGDCTLVKTPNGKSILVDCGSIGGLFDEHRVKQYIDNVLGANPEIDLLVVTHPDGDHGRDHENWST